MGRGYYSISYESEVHMLCVCVCVLIAKMQIITGETDVHFLFVVFLSLSFTCHRQSNIVNHMHK